MRHISGAVRLLKQLPGDSTWVARYGSEGKASRPDAMLVYPVGLEMAPTRPLGKNGPIPSGLPRLYMLISCWGVREKVRPRTSVGMLLM